jgi:hypothetical protein
MNTRLARSQNLTEATVFEKINKRNSLGEISLDKFDSNSNHKVVNIGVINIVSNCFNPIQTTTKVRHERTRSHVDFPSNLLADLKGTQAGT